MKSYIKILKKLISIDSGSGKSNKDIVFYIKSLFPNKLCKVQQYNYKGISYYNLIIKIKGNSSVNPLFFSGHTDTVQPQDKQWKRKCFNPKIVNSKLYGLGSSDMKSGLALMIDNAVKAMKSKLPRDVFLIFSADEETGGSGIRNIINFIPKINGRADIIVGEQTGGNLALGQKGCLDLKILMDSKAVHPANLSFRENYKINLIQKSLRLINNLNNWTIRENKRENRGALYKKYGGLIFNCGRIVAGVGANSMPEFLELLVNFRFIPNQKSVKDYKKELLNLIKKFDDKLKVEILFEGDGFETPLNNSLVKKIVKIYQQKLNLKPKIFYKKSWNEAVFYQRFGNVVILGPGTMGQGHNKNEYVKLDDLYKTSIIYQNLLKHKNLSF